MSREFVSDEPSYKVDGVPPAAKTLITKLMKASAEYAFMGAQPPSEHAAIEQAMYVARYNLEVYLKKLGNTK